MFPTRLITHVLLTASFILTISGCATIRESPPTAVQLLRMGNRYYAGVWVPRDVEKAADFYSQAALMGNPEALYLVGRCYDTGVGLPKNEVMAMENYRKSAYSGNPDAQYRLGLAYQRGTGTHKNLVLAYVWLNRAASSGMEKAASYRDALGCRMEASEVSRAQHISISNSEK